MAELRIYNYQNPRQFLAEEIARRQRDSRAFSLRALAKRMGISHSWLVLMLKSKRPLRVEHVAQFAKVFQLEARERLYLQFLVQFDGARSLEEKKAHAQSLADIHPGKRFNSREIDEYQILSNWLHLTLLSVMDLSGWDGTGVFLERKLKHRASPLEVRSALERLLEAGLVRREENGKLLKAYDWVSTRNDVSSQGARAYHKGVIGLALNAIEELGMESRENQSFSFAIEGEKLPLARQMIRDFRERLIKACASEKGDEVVQMNMQLFFLTEPSGKPKRAALRPGPSAPLSIDDRSQV